LKAGVQRVIPRHIHIDRVRQHQITADAHDLLCECSLDQRAGAGRGCKAGTCEWKRPSRRRSNDKGSVLIFIVVKKSALSTELRQRILTKEVRIFTDFALGRDLCTIQLLPR
jgi:hypothetical protein